MPNPVVNPDMLKDYDKDTLLGSGFAGAVYQVKILMLYAFEAFCNKETFYLQTEAKYFGKFDDLVIWKADKIQVLQAKHSYDPEGKYLLKHLVASTQEESQEKKKDKEKKVAIAKYLDSWLQIEAKKRSSPEKFANIKDIEYIFYTNHKLNTDEGLDQLHDDDDQSFSDDFISGNNLTATAQASRQAIIASIYTYLYQLQKDILAACAEFKAALEALTAPDHIMADINGPRSSAVCKLLAALRNADCLVKKGTKCKFTDKFINNDDLPPVLAKLHEILEWEKDDLKAFNFISKENNFFDVDAAEQSPSALSVALYTGYLGNDTGDFLSVKCIDALKEQMDEVEAQKRQQEQQALRDKIDEACKKLQAKLTGVDPKSRSIKAENNKTSVVCKLLGSLKHNFCIEKTDPNDKRKKPHYRFTKKFIDGNNLPPVIAEFRKLLSWDSNKLKDYTFSCVASDFFDLGNLTDQSSEFDRVLCGRTQIAGLFLDNDNARSGPLLALAKAFFDGFSFRVKEPNEAELTERLEDEIKKKFNNSDPHFYLHFYEKMLEKLLDKSGKSITEVDISEVFMLARTVFEANMLVGYGKRYEHHVTRSCNISLEDTQRRNLVKEVLESDNIVSVVYAEDDFTAALSVAHDLQKVKENNELLDNAYAFINSDHAFSKLDTVSFAAKDFQILIIDNADALNDEELQAYVDSVKKHGKRLVLLTNSQGQKKLVEKPNLDSVVVKEVAPLSLSVVRDNINKAGCKNKGCILGGRFISFLDMEKIDSLRVVITNPVYLQEMLAHAVTKPAEMTDSTEQKRLFIEPTIERQIPVYAWEMLLDFKQPVLLKCSGAELAKLTRTFELDVAKLLDEYEQDKSKITQLGTGQIINIYASTASVQDDKDAEHKDKLCITDITSYAKLPLSIRKAIRAYKNVVFVVENDDIPKVLQSLKRLEYVNEEGEAQYFKLSNPSHYKDMPKTSQYVQSGTYTGDDYQALLRRASYPVRSVLLSDYGSGKTYLTEQLDIDHALTSMGHSFTWVIRIPMKTLHKDFEKLTDAELAEHYLPQRLKYYWQRAALVKAIQTGDILWELDAFDEMTKQQLVDCAKLIERILKQPHCLVTSRPTAAHFIPVQANEYLALQPFDDKQIQRYIELFFTDEESRKLAEKQIQTLKESNNLALLGKPLLCRIACEILQDSLRTANRQSINYDQITMASLFEQFMLVNLKKFHATHNHVPHSRLIPMRVWQLSQQILERLQQAAHAKMMEIELALETDAALDEDIQKLGFVTCIRHMPAYSTSDYIFDHQTQVEYLTALYLINEILALNASDRGEHIRSKWQQAFYTVHMRVVWQFVAGMLTGKSTLLPINKLAAVRDLFCDFLLSVPKDQVGIVYEDIVSACVKNMDLSALGDRHRDALKHYRDIETPTQSIRQAREKIATHTTSVTVDHDDDKQYVEACKYITLANVPLQDIKEVTLDDGYEQQIGKLLEQVLTGSYPASVRSKLMNMIFSLDPQADVDLLSRIRLKLHKAYIKVSDSMNESTYHEAFALIVALIELDVFELKHFTKTFTKNFKQKNCLTDVLQLFLKNGLITDVLIDQLFACDYPRFWDLNAGLPAVLLLKRFLLPSMGQFIVKNISDRHSGDWEINSAYKILLRLAQFQYKEQLAVSTLCDTIVAIYDNDKNISPQSLTDITVSIFQVQIDELILNYFAEKFSNVSPTTLLEFESVVWLLFEFAKHFGLVIILQDDSLCVQGRINRRFALPNQPLAHKLILHTFTLLRAEASRLINDDSDDETEQKFQKLCGIVEKLEQCEDYQKNGEWLRFLSTRSTLAEEYRPELPVDALNKLAASVRVTDDRNFPDKDDFGEIVCCLAKYGCDLSFLSQLYQKAKPIGEYDWWDIDAGIPAVGYLGDYFSREAYEYLLTGINISYHQIRNAMKNAITDLSLNALHNEVAIYYFVKLFVKAHHIYDAPFDCFPNEGEVEGETSYSRLKIIKNMEKFDVDILLSVFRKLKYEQKQTKIFSKQENKFFTSLAARWEQQQKNAMIHDIVNRQVTETDIRAINCLGLLCAPRTKQRADGNRADSTDNAVISSTKCERSPVDLTS